MPFSLGTVAIFAMRSFGITSSGRLSRGNLCTTTTPFFSTANPTARTEFLILSLWDRSPATKKQFGNAKIVSSHDAKGQRLPSQTEGESRVLLWTTFGTSAASRPLSSFTLPQKPAASWNVLLEHPAMTGTWFLMPIVVAEPLLSWPMRLSADGSGSISPINRSHSY